MCPAYHPSSSGPSSPAARAHPAAGRRGADIPLRRDGMGRFLPWLVALMVFLATLAAAAAQSLASWGSRWDGGFSGSVTVQISPLRAPAPAPTPVGAGAGAGGQAGSADDDLDSRVQAVLQALGDAPGVSNARPLSMTDAQRLVEPWLGDGALVRDLPLPALIDVTVTPDADIAALRQRLTAAAPGVTVEEPGTWLKDLQRLALLAEAVAICVVLLIGGAAVVVVSFAARAGLAMHQEEVELLHVMGATDAYIARQFAGRMTRLALAGGGPAGVAAVLTLGGFSMVSHSLAGSLLPPLDLPTAAWAWMAAVPVAAVLLATIVARVTVLRALGRLA